MGILPKRETNRKTEEMKMKYDFQKELTKDSKHWAKIRKKFKNRKFTKDELVARW
jgi:hypothetical protein